MMPGPTGTVLPSIQDMFPDHLLHLPLPGGSHSFWHQSNQHNHHHECHCSRACSSSKHPPLSLSGHPYLTVKRRTKSGKGSRSSSCHSSDGEDDHVTGESERKHICRLCDKKFNRPSSLRIHMNTHTGATPFACPFPGCGRSFNVNSNMRRHYRNHRGAVPEETSQRRDADVEDDWTLSDLDHQKRRTHPSADHQPPLPLHTSYH